MYYSTSLALRGSVSAFNALERNAACRAGASTFTVEHAMCKHLGRAWLPQESTHEHTREQHAWDTGLSSRREHFKICLRMSEAVTRVNILVEYTCQKSRRMSTHSKCMPGAQVCWVGVRTPRVEHGMCKYLAPTVDT